MLDTDPERIQLLSSYEVQAILGIKATTLYHLTKSGEIASVKIGKRRLYPRSALVAYVTDLTRFQDSVGFHGK